MAVMFVFFSVVFWLASFTFYTQSSLVQGNPPQKKTQSFGEPASPTLLSTANYNYNDEWKKPMNLCISSNELGTGLGWFQKDCRN